MFRGLSDSQMPNITLTLKPAACVNTALLFLLSSLIHCLQWSDSYSWSTWSEECCSGGGFPLKWTAGLSFCKNSSCNFFLRLSVTSPRKTWLYDTELLLFRRLLDFMIFSILNICNDVKLTSVHHSSQKFRHHNTECRMLSYPVTSHELAGFFFSCHHLYVFLWITEPQTGPYSMLVLLNWHLPGLRSILDSNCAQRNSVTGYLFGQKEVHF